MARSGGQFFVEIGRKMSTLAQENVAIHERPVSDVFHQRRSKKWGAVTFSFATGAIFCAWRKGRRSKLRPGRPAIFCVRGANTHHPDAQVRRLPATQTKQPQQKRWQKTRVKSTQFLLHLTISNKFTRRSFVVGSIGGWSMMCLKSMGVG